MRETPAPQALLLCLLTLFGTGCRSGGSTTVINNPTPTPTPTATPQPKPGATSYEQLRRELRAGYETGYDEGFAGGRDEPTPGEREERRNARRERWREARRAARSEILHDLLREEHASRFGDLVEARNEALRKQDPEARFRCPAPCDPDAPGEAEGEEPVEPSPDNLECWKALCPSVAALIDEPRRGRPDRPWLGRPRPGRPRPARPRPGRRGEPPHPAELRPEQWMVDVDQLGLDLPTEAEWDGLDEEARQARTAELVEAATAKGREDGEADQASWRADRRGHRRELRERIQRRMRARIERRLKEELREALDQCADTVAAGATDCPAGETCEESGLPTGK